LRDSLHGAANGDSVCLCGEACASVRCRASASEVSRRCCYYYCRRLLVPVSVFAVFVVVVVVVLSLFHSYARVVGSEGSQALSSQAP
jgi:hypothetical protein